MFKMVTLKIKENRRKATNSIRIGNRNRENVK